MDIPFWLVLPFAGMLLSIALIPLKWGEWWEKNQLLVAILWSLAFCVPFGILYGGETLLEQLSESLVGDYLPFIVLLFGLFVTTGGIAIRGTIAGTTRNNALLLLIGTVLASWIGTTGAAMLLIRPVLSANRWRRHKAHVVIFFIFLVANIGGCLTPLGDPPLFLGYLRGVPFFWTLQHILPMLVLNTALLLAAFVAIDRHYLKKETAEGRSPADLLAPGEKPEKIRIDGWHNFIFVGVIVVAVILNGTLAGVSETAYVDVFGTHLGLNTFVELGLIALATVLSLLTTPKACREHNEFSYGPIAEVAKLFIGIFITMIPALVMLRENGASLGIDTPLKFFWATGMLSSFLDNSPTYVVFLTTAGALGAATGVATTVGVVNETILLAISAGAVFMGAITYIGNAPNFMVCNIAQSRDVKMPSFFGYMGWSCAILVPVFVIDSLVFFL